LESLDNVNEYGSGNAAEHLGEMRQCDKSGDAYVRCFNYMTEGDRTRRMLSAADLTRNGFDYDPASRIWRRNPRLTEPAWSAPSAPPAAEHQPSLRLLPADSAARKTMPLYRGLLDYFPAACAAVAQLSYIGNEQHNPGQPMHWAREKSTDHEDCIVRHLLESGTVDTDGVRHTAKLAWRALALLQTEMEDARKNGEVVWSTGPRPTV
jgi:hypothetical protein